MCPFKIYGTYAPDTTEGRQTKLSPVCTNCRAKHLRCDGGPMCSRCRKSGASCVFVPSRRGMRPPKLTSIKTALDVSDHPSVTAPSDSSTWSPVSSSPSPKIEPLSEQQAFPAHSASEAPLHRIPGPIYTNDPERLVDSFYSLFFPARQFILPRQILLRNLGNPDLQYLRAVIEQIGSRCNPPTFSSEQQLFSQPYPSNAYSVQALLLLALWYGGVPQSPEALRCLRQARDLAYMIGMDQAGFATVNSNGSRYLEHSWLSTWHTILQMGQYWCVDSVENSIDPKMRITPQRKHYTSRVIATPLPSSSNASCATVQWDNTKCSPAFTVGDYTPVHAGETVSETDLWSIPLLPAFGPMETHDPSMLREMPMVWNRQQGHPTIVNTTAFSQAASWPL